MMTIVSKGEKWKHLEQVNAKYWLEFKYKMQKKYNIKKIIKKCIRIKIFTINTIRKIGKNNIFNKNLIKTI